MRWRSEECTQVGEGEASDALHLPPSIVAKENALVDDRPPREPTHKAAKARTLRTFLGPGRVRRMPSRVPHSGGSRFESTSRTGSEERPSHDALDLIGNPVVDSRSSRARLLDRRDGPLGRKSLLPWGKE